MSKLNERTVLSSLHIGSWSGRSVDHEVTEEVSESHRADPKASGHYSKQLIAVKFLKPINSKIAVARRTHRILTLPWDDDARILSTIGYQHYTEQMRLHRLGVDAGATEFCKNYQSFIDEAKIRLGTMYDGEDYPTSEEVRKKFWLDVEIKPVPTAGDFRAELSDASVKAVVHDIENRSNKRLEKAMDDVFNRIIECTGKMAERLRAYEPAAGGDKAKNTFKDSLIYNIKELADLLPALNVTGDKRLDDLQAQLLKDLVEHSPEVLRADESKRAKTA